MIGIILFLKHSFVSWLQTMGQMRKDMNITLKQKESHCFLRNYVNSKRMRNSVCLWILDLAKMKILFKKIFEASL